MWAILQERWHKKPQFCFDFKVSQVSRYSTKTLSVMWVSALIDTLWSVFHIEVHSCICNVPKDMSVHSFPLIVLGIIYAMGWELWEFLKNNDVYKSQWQIVPALLNCTYHTNEKAVTYCVGCFEPYDMLQYTWCELNKIHNDVIRILIISAPELHMCIF